LCSGKIKSKTVENYEHFPDKLNKIAPWETELKANLLNMRTQQSRMENASLFAIFIGDEKNCSIAVIMISTGVIICPFAA
jgi:hypothetical protein